MRLLPLDAAAAATVLQPDGLGRLAASYALPGLHAGRGWPSSETVIALSFLDQGGRTWLIVDGDDAVIGELGTKGPPASRRVEIGYGLIPGMRGAGRGTAAVAALLDLLAADPDIDLVEAFVARDNVASRRLLARLGFTTADPEAPEIRYGRPTRP